MQNHVVKENRQKLQKLIGKINILDFSLWTLPLDDTGNDSFILFIDMFSHYSYGMKYDVNAMSSMSWRSIFYHYKFLIKYIKRFACKRFWQMHTIFQCCFKHEVWEILYSRNVKPINIDAKETFMQSIFQMKKVRWLIATTIERKW